jgi:hypothetical protein
MVGSIRIFLLGAVLWGAVACKADGSQTLFIKKMAGAGDECAPQPDGEEFDGRGFVDSNSPRGLKVFPVVENTADEQDGLNVTRRTVYTGGFEITIRLDEDLVSAKEQQELQDSGQLKYTFPWTAAIGPNDLALGNIDAVPGEVLQFISSLAGGETTVAYLEMVAFGELGSRVSVDSPPFVWPFEVCTDCLLEILPSCTNLPSSIGGGSPCGTGYLQDNELTCCMDSMNRLICPAEEEMMTVAP